MYPESCGTYPADTAYLLTCHIIEYVLPLLKWPWTAWHLLAAGRLEVR